MLFFLEPPTLFALPTAVDRTFGADVEEVAVRDVDAAAFAPLFLPFFRDNFFAFALSAALSAIEAESCFEVLMAAVAERLLARLLDIAIRVCVEEGDAGLP